MVRPLIALTAVAAAALPVAAASAGSNDLHVFFPSDCQTNAYKPKSLVATCADANFQVVKIKWSHYGAKTATGRGTARINLCDPSCVAGKTKSFPARIRLSRVKQCGDVPQFTRLTVTLTGARPKGQKRVTSWPFPCADAPTR